MDNQKQSTIAPDVALAACGEYTPEACRKALEEVLEPFGGLSWVQPGMRIGIKVNLVAGMKPEAAATTHPVLLCELVKLLLEKGAKPVVGDSPGGLYTAAAVGFVYKGAGMHAVEACGGELNHDFSTCEISYPEAKIAKSFSATAWLKSCDAIINFCKLKSHGMMGFSCAAKNLFGTIPGTQKPEYHFRFPKPEDFADMLVDLDDYWAPRIHICDAVVAMEGNGPTAGTPRTLGLVLAAENPHRLDLLGTRLICLEPEAVPTLMAARRRGYIPETAEELRVQGDWQAHICPDFERIEERRSLQFVGKGPIGSVIEEIMRQALESRPKPVKSECIGCGKCAGICPAKAIEIKNRLPSIDRSKCIRCFCCQEFCPKGAMKVRRTLLARILSR